MRFMVLISFLILLNGCGMNAAFSGKNESNANSSELSESGHKNINNINGSDVDPSMMARLSQDCRWGVDAALQIHDISPKYEWKYNFTGMFVVPGPELGPNPPGFEPLNGWTCVLVVPEVNHPYIPATGVDYDLQWYLVAIKNQISCDCMNESQIGGPK